jgi:hypothetical protein
LTNTIDYNSAELIKAVKDKVVKAQGCLNGEKAKLRILRRPILKGSFVLGDNDNCINKSLVGGQCYHTFYSCNV